MKLFLRSKSAGRLAVLLCLFLLINRKRHSNPILVKEGVGVVKWGND